MSNEDRQIAVIDSEQALQARQSALIPASPEIQNEEEPVDSESSENILEVLSRIADPESLRLATLYFSLPECGESISQRARYLQSIQSLIFKLVSDSLPEAQLDTDDSLSHLQTTFSRKIESDKTRVTITEPLFKHILLELIDELYKQREILRSGRRLGVESYSTTISATARIQAAVELLPPGSIKSLQDLLTVRMSETRPRSSFQITRRAFLGGVGAVGLLGLAAKETVAFLVQQALKTPAAAHANAVYMTQEVDIAPILLQAEPIEQQEVLHLLGFPEYEQLNSHQQLECEELTQVISGYLDPLLKIIYSNCDGTHRRESFAAFRTALLAKIVDLCRERNLRITEYIWLCAISADNSNESYKDGKYQSDVDIRKAQLAIGSVASVNQSLAAELITLLFTPTPNSISFKRGAQATLSPDLPGAFVFYEGVRSAWGITFGPHDLERIMYALAYARVHGREALSNKSSMDFELVEAYEALKEKRAEAKKAFDAFLRDHVTYILQKDGRDIDFWSDVLEIVGISNTGMSALQLARTTAVWEVATTTGAGDAIRVGDLRTVYERLLRDVCGRYFGMPGQTDDVLRLLSDQFAHPAFFHFFEELMKKFDIPSSDISEFKTTLEKLRAEFLAACNRYDQQDAVLSQVAATEEKNLPVQTEQLLLPPLYFLEYTRDMLAEEKLFVPGENGVSTLEIFLANCIREIAPVNLLAGTENFGKTIHADIPYVPEATLKIIFRELRIAKEKLQKLFGGASDRVDAELLAVWMSTMVSENKFFFKFNEYLEARGITFTVMDDIQSFFFSQVETLNKEFGTYYSSLHRADAILQMQVQYIKMKYPNATVRQDRG